MTRRLSKGALAAGVLAFVLYLPGFWWGAPHATSPQFKRSWGVDDESPLGPLAEIHNILEPKPDRNLGYPLLLSFILAACYAPYLAFLWLSGGLSGFSGVYPYGLSDPVASLKSLTYIAHFVAVLMGVGVVVFAYLAARTLWGRRTGLVAALLVATSYPMFYYARNANVDVPMLFFVAGATWAVARYLVAGASVARAVVLGGFVGAAMATKESALGSFLVLPALFLLRSPEAGGEAANERRPWRQGWGFLASLLLALGLGSGFLVEPGRYMAHLEFITGRLGELKAEASPLAFAYPYSWDGHLGYCAQMVRLLVDIMTLPGLLLAVAGLAFLCLRERRFALIPLMGVASLAFLFLALRAAQLRYLLPAAFALYLGAARMHGRLVEHHSRPVRALAWLVVVFIVTLGLMRGASLTHEMIFDSRYAAGAWLAERTEPGDRVDFFGPESKLPPFEAGVVVERAAPYLGVWRPLVDEEETAKAVLARWQFLGPKYIVLIPDLTSRDGKAYNFTCPESVCEGLLRGDLAYRQVAFFRTRPVFDWLPRPALDYPTVNPPIRVFAVGTHR